MVRHRFDTLAPARFRVQPVQRADSIATLTGYALVYNTISSDRGGYVVRLLLGSAAFASQTLALYGHDYKRVLGSTASKTLRLDSDSYGVRFSLDLPDTQTAREVLTLVRRGDVTGMSFGMTDTPRGKERTEGGVTVLEVSQFTLDEVTITPIPAFDATSVTTEDGTIAPTPYGPQPPAAVFPLYANKRAAVFSSERVTLARARLEACRLLPG